MCLLYGAWPDRLVGLPTHLNDFPFGVLWVPPNTDPTLYYVRGDRPWYAEYHWHGAQSLAGNAYLLGGLALLLVLLVAAARARTPDGTAGQRPASAT